MPQQKDRLLFLLELLNRETDDDHPITITQILERLKADGIDGNRRTVAHDLAVLSDNGVDVVCNKSTQNQYFIGDRHFELPELKLLVDAVQASKFISAKKSKQLIEKLAAFTSVHQADKLNRQLYVDKQAKADNESILFIVDQLHAATNDGVKVCFQYYEYSPYKRKVKKHDGQVYGFSPYGQIWNNDCYYVLGYSDTHGKIVKFRVDRMTGVKITQEPAQPKPKNFRIEEYAKSVFQMYDEETRTVTLLCENGLMKSIIDRFGTKVKTAAADDEHFTAEVEVSVSPTFFGWIFSFDGRMSIKNPDDVKARYLEQLNKATRKP
jgi:predicted DNA-binding transcriptional regulator YafY